MLASSFVDCLSPVASILHVAATYDSHERQKIKFWIKINKT